MCGWDRSNAQTESDIRSESQSNLPRIGQVLASKAGACSASGLVGRKFGIIVETGHYHDEEVVPMEAKYGILLIWKEHGGYESVAIPGTEFASIIATMVPASLVPVPRPTGRRAAE